MNAAAIRPCQGGRQVRNSIFSAICGTFVAGLCRSSALRLAIGMSSRVSDPGATARKREIPRSERAAHYQKFAIQIRELADAETDTALRDKLINLARQYTAMAVKLNAKSV